MIDEGMVCIKKTGRDAGEKCVVINVLDPQFVEIVTKNRKQARKANVSHLKPIEKKVDPKSEEQIKAALSE